MTTFDQIEEYVRSKLGISPPVGSIAKSLGDLRPTSTIDVNDEIETVAGEVCAIACREGGLILPQHAVAKRLRDLMEVSERKLEVLLNAFAAVGRPMPRYPSAIRFREALARLADEILTEPIGYRFLRERPIKPRDVCRECESGWVKFSKKPADTGAWKDQVDTIHDEAMKRIDKFKLAASVETSVITRRGECGGVGHDERGHGWLELSAILVKVDLGDGVVIEKEYRINLPGEQT